MEPCSRSIFDQHFDRVIDNEDMYVTEVPNRGAKPTVLLRESYREQGKVKSRTLANLTNLPAHLLDAVKRAAKDEVLVNAADSFGIERSRHHGHVQAVLGAMRRLAWISSSPPSHAASETSSSG